MEYDFRKIEEECQKRWKEDGVYKVSNTSDKPKFYVLDMFPYPSGAGLHVGHPLGYIASDIYSRYKRLKGYNVLHPMGFDSFGLPAEQYALETGQHPATTTEKNIETFKAQLDKIGFCYDWDRELRTSDPSYYKWTQWIFLQLFNTYFCHTQKKALPISLLVKKYETKGSAHFTGGEWKAFTKKEQEDILMKRRLAFSAYGEVNWCEALGTVLANDEVVNGVSERGGHPVVKKKMRQWYLRITEYADRLLEGLETVSFSDAMKEMQRNWIGKSEGAEILFPIIPNPSPRGEKGNAENEAKWAAIVPKYKVSSPMQYELAKGLRKEYTEAENLLWQELRNNKLDPKFRRQHPIDSFIVDFICLQHALIVEADGGYHENAEQKKYDENRTKILNEIGFAVLRFTNEEIIKDIKKVISKIKESLQISETQHNSENIKDHEFSHPTPLVEKGPGVRVYTTRPDTIFGVDFLVLAPEHELVSQITSAAQKSEIEIYLTYVKSRSDRERIAEVKQITGCFTGAYAENPFDGKLIPIWIAEYVLAGYGTGAIMAVPCGDQRDFTFAKHFNIPITNIIGGHYKGEEANATKDAVLQNSGFLDGMLMKDAIAVAINKIEEEGIGKRKINYRMRDAGFSRQRYWGEPFPIIWSDGIAIPLDAKELPLELPFVEKYGPGPEGEGPLANIKEWTSSPTLLHGVEKIDEKNTAKNEAKQEQKDEKNSAAHPFNENIEGIELSRPSPLLEQGPRMRETSTMPGYAGSSWYFLRYMDPKNAEIFCDRNASDYWNQVDVYIGGTEHAVGHLLYSRMWTKVLYDLNLIGFDEPFKKLVNQGMITGKSYFFKVIKFPGDESLKDRTYIIPENKEWEDLELRPKDTLFAQTYLRFKYGHQYVDSNGRLTKKAFEIYSLEHGEEYSLYTIEWNKDSNEEFIYVKEESEKMSKSKFNVDNPDDLVNKYGADTFRMYEMFLGPVEQSKPWDTKGIEGVHRFLRKLWRLFYDEVKGQVWTNEKAIEAELKVLHKTIKKIEYDTENFSFNTAVSAFMISVNELADLKCHKKEVLENILILLVPYAPHVAEELWGRLGNKGTILNAAYPVYDEKYLVETSKDYPISINGKMRATINIAMDAAQPEVEKIVLQNEIIQKWLEGKVPKKIIFVKGKMVNVVV